MEQPNNKTALARSMFVATTDYIQSCDGSFEEAFGGYTSNGNAESAMQVFGHAINKLDLTVELPEYGQEWADAASIVGLQYRWTLTGGIFVMTEFLLGVSVIEERYSDSITLLSKYIQALSVQQHRMYHTLIRDLRAMIRSFSVVRCGDFAIKLDRFAACLKLPERTSNRVIAAAERTRLLMNMRRLIALCSDDDTVVNLPTLCPDLYPLMFRQTLLPLFARSPLSLTNVHASRADHSSICALVQGISPETFELIKDQLRTYPCTAVEQWTLQRVNQLSLRHNFETKRQRLDIEVRVSID
jgi:hypothetical protein